MLIERGEHVGGLAKSHTYGGHIFDTGPKRFHTDDPVSSSIRWKAICFGFAAPLRLIS